MVPRMPIWAMVPVLAPGAFLVFAMSMPGLLKLAVWLLVAGCAIATFVCFDREEKRIKLVHKDSAGFINAWAKQHREIKLTLPIPWWFSGLLVLGAIWSVTATFEVLGSTVGVVYVVGTLIAVCVGIAIAEGIVRDQAKRPRH